VALIQGSRREQPMIIIPGHTRESSLVDMRGISVNLFVPMTAVSLQAPRNPVIIVR
jgi:3-polyprenyl-4-hydroxybenzoate decarboxylase